MEFKETTDLEPLVALAKSLDMRIHPLDNVIAAWGAFEHKEFVGGVILRCSNEFYQLDLICVKKEFQSRGIGKKLIELVENEARSRGAKKLYLITRRAVGYYPRFGFRKIPEEKFPECILVCKDCEKKAECSPFFFVKDL